jgi:hypothetical protein
MTEAAVAAIGVAGALLGSIPLAIIYSFIRSWSSTTWPA